MRSLTTRNDCPPNYKVGASFFIYILFYDVTLKCGKHPIVMVKSSARKAR